jgi:signal peptidase II
LFALLIFGDSVRALWITAVALVLDQLSKWWVMESMHLYESVSVIGHFFRFTYIHNPGAVFGLRLGGAYFHLALAVVALVFVCVLLWRLPPGSLWPAVGLALVLGGAIGNMIDRLRFGVVIDFLDFGVGDTRWWIFNLADSWVSVGTVLLLFTYGLQSSDEADDDAIQDTSK